MQVIDQSVRIIGRPNRKHILNHLAYCGRVSHRTETDSIARDPAGFVKRIVSYGHMSVLEHASVTLEFITNRAIATEMTRHRFFSPTQESTRYCNYGNKKFNKEIVCVHPLLDDKETQKIWFQAMRNAEKAYMSLLEKGVPPEIARGVLPLDLKAKLVITSTLRGWYEAIEKRVVPEAHPQIRFLMWDALVELNNFLPEIFGDLKNRTSAPLL